jgi:hypothetical protein
MNDHPLAPAVPKRSLQAQLRLGIVAAGVLVMLGLSMLQTYSLGQHAKMYDNPIYRWRESLAIALSRMQTPPLHGYLAYRSIRDYLNEHGLALVSGEAKTMPTPAQLHALVIDGDRMNQLIQDASRVPIDPSLKPVVLTGNELGLVDFFYWSFRIFGLKISSLVLLYYSILLTSVALFFIAFRRSPFCLLMLMLYLGAHYFAVSYSDFGQIQTIHNSRFFPVLSLLPAMHLVLLLLRRERPSMHNIVGAAVQTSILFFTVFCRNEAWWQVLAILACAPLALNFRSLWHALPVPRRRWLPAVGSVAQDVWPTFVVFAGLVGYLAYNAYVPDRRFYREETKGHLFWHAIYTEMVGADPELMIRYGYGDEPHGDGLGYMTALHYLRGRNEAPQDFATVVDGVINIDVLKNSAELDRIVRHAFFEVLAEHPWLALRSFFVGKLINQYQMFTHVPILWLLPNYLPSFAIAFMAVILALIAGLKAPDREQLHRTVSALVLVAPCSLITTLMVPSVLIPDIIAFYVLLALFAIACLALLAIFWVMPRALGAAAPDLARTGGSAR